MMNDKYRRLGRIMLIALLFSFTAVLGAPLKVQTTNQNEFVYASADLVKALLPAFLLCLAGLVGLLALLRGRTQRYGLCLLFMLSLLLWLQGNFLAWDYGALDGREIDWPGLWYLGVLDGMMWLAGLGLAVRYSDWMVRNLVGMASVLLILVQCVAIYVSQSSGIPADKYKVDWQGQFVFSSEKNVILLSVDAFQTDVFQELIDEDPALRGFFDGFVYFRNSTSGFRQSYPSIPNMLTATYFDNSQPMWDYLRGAYLGESSLPKVFLDHGFRSEVYEGKAGLHIDPRVISNTSLSADFEQASSQILYNIDVALFLHVPHFLKKLVYNNQLWLFSRWFPAVAIGPGRLAATTRVDGESGVDYVDLSRRPARLYFTQDNIEKLSNLRFVDSLVNRSRIGYEEPVFKFFHIMGIHLPIRMSSDFQYIEPERSRASLKDLALGVVRLIDMALDGFRELGIFDDALIIVAADHGIWTEISEVRIPGHIERLYGENRAVSAELLPESKGTVLPLVLVKRVGAHGEMVINDAPVALSDIPRTLVSEMGFDARSFPGESMFDLRENQVRKRLVHFSTFRENPSYSEPYRSTMTEFEVEGFSWLNQAWRKTGVVYPPAE